MKRLVFGWGINDADYKVCIKKIVYEEGASSWEFICPYYKCWSNMLKRCYSESSKKNQPSYAHTECCDEWRSFMAFRAWMERHEWQGMELDKDLLGDGHLYSPETCCFLPKEVNLFFTNCRREQGDGLQGVSKTAYGTFRSQITIAGTKVMLGSFATEEAAHSAWRKAKFSAVLALSETHRLSDRIANAITSKLIQLLSENPIAE